MNGQKKTDEGRLFSKDIKVKDGSLYYGDFHALKGINIEIPPERVTAFIGPSGCARPRF